MAHGCTDGVRRSRVILLVEVEMAEPVAPADDAVWVYLRAALTAIKDSGARI